MTYRLIVTARDSAGKLIRPRPTTFRPYPEGTNIEVVNHHRA